MSIVNPSEGIVAVPSPGRATHQLCIDTDAVFL